MPKPEKGVYRPIIDLSELNKFLIVPKFRMDTLAKVVKDLCQGLWGTSIDLDNAYYSVPMAPEFQKYLAFILGDRIFVFQVLPFGLSLAPWAFTRVLKPVKTHLRLKGMILVVTGRLPDSGGVRTLGCKPHPPDNRFSARDGLHNKLEEVC